jgi:hypothetical protein
MLVQLAPLGTVQVQNIGRMFDHGRHMCLEQTLKKRKEEGHDFLMSQSTEIYSYARSKDLRGIFFISSAKH